jgi:hypothetical protein
LDDVKDENIGTKFWKDGCLADFSTLPYGLVSFARGGLVESIREG